MYERLSNITLLLAATEIIAAIVCGLLSSRESISLRKGRQTLAATLLFGSVFLTMGIGQFFQLQSLPVLSTEGDIVSVNVHSQGKGYRTDFTVHESGGMTYHLNADGRSDLFRQGEHVVLTYYGYTGSVIKVHFLAPSGSEEGVFKSTQNLGPVMLILLGLFCCGAGYKKFRRNPEDSIFKEDQPLPYR